MTAEIAILNKEAIALAADSAVTVETDRGQKIFTSANKLFALSKFHPVGVMVYGSANFMGIPWDIIIKSYRKKLGIKKFNKLNQYAKNLISFLNSNALFSKKQQDIYFLRCIYSYFREIRDEIEEVMQDVLKKENIADKERIQTEVFKIVDKHHRKCKVTKDLFNKTVLSKKIQKKYNTEIKKAIKDIFENIHFSSAYGKKLKEIVICLFTKDMWASMMTSGIVVAGFGEKDVFPDINEFRIEGVVCGHLKYVEKKHQGISFNNTSSIIPFAQREMVATFMEGMEPSLKQEIEGFWAEIFKKYPELLFSHLEKHKTVIDNKIKEKIISDSEKIFIKYKEKLKNIQRQYYISPVVSVVGMLPKEELAMMAEALVNLT